MAMPTKNSRKIVVDDVEYRWAYSETWEPRTCRKDSDLALGLSLTVETIGQVNVRLSDHASFPASAMAGDCFETGVVVQPRHVAAFIKKARDAGWLTDTMPRNKNVDLLHDIVLNDPQYGSY